MPNYFRVYKGDKLMKVIETDLDGKAAAKFFSRVVGKGRLEQLSGKPTGEGKVQKWYLARRKRWLEENVARPMPTYHGIIRGRKECEYILGAALPREAEVMFAWAAQRWIPQPEGGSLGHQLGLIVWTIDRKFFEAGVSRQEIEDEFTGVKEWSRWKIEDMRVHPERALAGLDKVAEANKWDVNLKVAHENIYRKMIRLEQEWANERASGVEPEVDKPVSLTGTLIEKPSEN